MSTVAGTARYLGTSVPRREDRVAPGGARFVDDLTLPGTVYMAVVRLYAHARIRGLSLDAARSAEGVVAAFSGADSAGDSKASLPCAWPVTEDIKMPPHYPLAVEEARFQGDGVAVVIADSRGAAKDAAETVDVDYEPLDAVADVEKALAEGAPLVHSDFGTNECYVWPLATDGFDDALAAAEVTVTCRYYQPRLIPNAIEPRGALAQVGPSGELTLWSATQIPHILRFALQIVLGIPEAKIRVITPDVGGGFGSKLNVYAEEALVAALAARLQSGKLTEERLENAVATIHGRDVVTGAHLRRDEGREDHSGQGGSDVRDGRVPPARHAWHPAARRLDLQRRRHPQLQRALHRRLHPHDAHRRVPWRRSAGGDVRDRADDRGAGGRARHGQHRVAPEELHRGVPAHARLRTDDHLGTTTRTSTSCSSCSTSRNSVRASARRERGDTKQLGVGFSTYNEMCGLAPSRILGAIRYAVGGWDSATIRFQPLGSVQVITGTSPHGQSPRDLVGADRSGRPGCRHRRRRGAARRHRRLAARHGHRSRSLAVGESRRTRARRSSRRRARSSPTSSRWRRTTWSSPTAASR